MRTTLFSLIFGVLLFGGCLWGKKDVVVAPDEMIYTLPAGQEVSLLLDKQPVTRTFAIDMKLVSPDNLVLQQEKENERALAAKATAKKSTRMWGIIGGLIAAIAAGLGIWFKLIKQPEPKK